MYPLLKRLFSSFSIEFPHFFEKIIFFNNKCNTLKNKIIND